MIEYFRMNMNLLCLRAVILAVAFFLILPPGVKADTPSQVVERLHDELLQVMKDAEVLGYTGRYEKLAKVIPAIYDFPFISKTVVGRYWRTFSDEEKKKFLDLFTRLSVATYANRFDGYSGESFSVISANESRRGRIVVESVLVQPSGEKIEFSYILHKKNHMWKIINVVVEGVSDLSLKRADYTAFLKKKNTEAFLDELKAKISKFSD